MIEVERAGLRGDPDQEAKAWVERIADVDHERRGYLRLAAKGHMSDAELDEALVELEETRETADIELQALASRQEVIEQLKRDKDALMESYARMTPEALDNLTSEERHQVYKMLRLKVVVYADGCLDISGALRDCFTPAN